MEKRQKYKAVYIGFEWVKELNIQNFHSCKTFWFDFKP